MFINTVFEQGLQAHQQGDLQTAQACYQKVLEQSPEHADALHLSGVLAKQLNAPDIAIDMIKKAIALNPQASAYYNNLALVYRDIGDNDSALLILKRALDINADDALAQFNLGNVLVDLEQPQQAIAHYQRALEIDPQAAAAMNNLGELFFKQQAYDKAITWLQQAVTLQPQLQKAHANLGHIYRRTKQLEQAQKHYQIAMQLDSRDMDTIYGLGLVELQLGEYEAGWDKYQARFLNSEPVPHLHVDIPAWSGVACDGHVLVWAEQGVGDEVMFASLLPALLQQVNKVSVECDPRLIPLFSRAFPTIDLYAKGSLALQKQQGLFDYQVPMGGLPKFLGFPQACENASNYLQAEPPVRNDDNGPLRIGISWLSKNKQSGHLRSLPFSSLLPLLKSEGCEFVNLQFGDVSAEQQLLDEHGVAWENQPGIDMYADLDGLASRIAGLDLVISADNTIVHLAAALGIETWVMLNSYCDWRWGRDNNNSIWYPGIKLLRQHKLDEWESVVEQACLALQEKRQQCLDVASSGAHG